MGQHSFRECNAKATKACVNCSRAGMKGDALSHNAMDSKCPQYLRQVEAVKNRTDYGAP